jgi:hypothetical protein
MLSQIQLAYDVRLASAPDSLLTRLVGILAVQKFIHDGLLSEMRGRSRSGQAMLLLKATAVASGLGQGRSCATWLLSRQLKIIIAHHAYRTGIGIKRRKTLAYYERPQAVHSPEQ